MLQDYPPANDVFFSVPLVCRLIAEFPQIVVFKSEDNPGLGKLVRIRETCAKEGIRRISILSGRGALFAALALIRGADGVASGFAYPEMLSRSSRARGAGRPSGRLRPLACSCRDCHELQPKSACRCASTSSISAAC
jgi:4-hydroxy-tetrahydrodipicolinate synthase